MALRIALAVFILVIIYIVLGASATLASALLMIALIQCRHMIWHAHRRNSLEQQEFQLVNTGQKEPDPSFLTRVWS